MTRQETIELNKKILPYLREYAPGHYISEIQAELIARFGHAEYFNNRKRIKSLIDRQHIILGKKINYSRDTNCRTKYTSEIMSYIINHVDIPSRELYADVLNKWPELSDKINYKSFCRQRKIYNCQYETFPAEVREYLIEHNHSSYDDLIPEIKKRFGRTYTHRQLSIWYSHHGYCPEERKRKTHPTVSPIGTERKVCGYWEVKVDLPRKWRRKAAVVWEQYHNTKVPRGHQVIFVDGNNDNFDIDNLRCIDKRIMSTLAAKGVFNIKDAELRELGINIATLSRLERDKETTP